MSKFRYYNPSSFSGMVIVALMSLTPITARAQVMLSNNLTNVSGGVETATGTNWLTASFGTDASSYILNNVTLLLANTTSGTAEVDLYSNDLLEPGTPSGTLTSPGSYSTSLANTTFTSSGLTLAANTTYWVVLKANSGSFDWSWTTEDTGTGVGFQDTWGNSADAGATWFTFVGFPTQMSVTATAASAAVPEPGALAFLMTGAVGTGMWLRRHKRGAYAK